MRLDSLSGRNRTVPHLLQAAGQTYGDKIAWTDGRRSLPFSSLSDVAARGAGALLSRGIGPGDRVMVIAENRLETLELLLASAWLGSILAPINPATPEAQLQYFLEYLDPMRVFVEDEAATTKIKTANSGVSWQALPKLEDSESQGPGNCWLDADHAPLSTESVPQTPLTILLTSGTTGVSKGVVCPQAQFLAWGESVSAMLALDRDDVAYTCLPLFHTNALNAAFQSLVSGATFFVGPRFSSSRFWQRVTSAEATASYLLGAMVNMLLNVPDGDHDQAHKVSRILAPGTPVPAVKLFEERFGVTLVEAHGMTETNAVLGTALGQGRLGFMGKEMPGYQADVVDEFDEPVTDGVPGELVLRSNIPYAFASGYWNMPEVTVDANRNQWFHTGDRVIREGEWFRFLDRIKDVIRRRGENISAWEVERVLDEHPLVESCAVIPVPSELGEDEVMAFVITEEGKDLHPEELRQHCSAALPSFAWPRFVEFVSDLPLTDTGKIRKQLLRDRGVGPSTWDANSEQHASRPH